MRLHEIGFRLRLDCALHFLALPSAESGCLAEPPNGSGCLLAVPFSPARVDMNAGATFSIPTVPSHSLTTPATLPSPSRKSK